ncbi:MAG: hypothetical protein EOR60_14995 [Mesorhizobium sp.]|nr:MAG: hypothetical protein EOR60_14995 [Mesorhizobium sp.]
MEKVEAALYAFLQERARVIMCAERLERQLRRGDFFPQHPSLTLNLLQMKFGDRWMATTARH